ncbi:hypothetical protein VP275E431_P0019 [Vibrio phage 275E43-1]|nr:hypothetical protein VP275E431_P0019 [Vibrio phage 275E43-1]
MSSDRKPKNKGLSRKEKEKLERKVLRKFKRG